MFAVDLDVGDVVLEDGGDVDLGELVLAEDDQQARLPARAVAHDHQLLPDGRHGVAVVDAVAPLVTLKNRTVLLNSTISTVFRLSQGYTNLSRRGGILLFLEGK